MRLNGLIGVAACLTLYATPGAAQSADTTRRDSAQAAQAARVRQDSVAKEALRLKRDSVARGDSAIVQKDSSGALKKDTIGAVDSTATAKDSTAKDSTSIVADSTVALDSTTAKDSTALARDSTVAADSTIVAKDSVADYEPAVVTTAMAPPPVHVTMPPFRGPKDSLALVRTIRAGLGNPGWPVKGPSPGEGAILPAKRIVAFYGSTLSKRMGILGQIPPDSMLARLEEVAAEWQAADSATPVQMALHYVAVVAQADAGTDGKYRYRMDSTVIEKVYGWALRKNAILFLDIQPGRSSVMDELPHLARFLERANVHLGIDPEFNMRNLRDTLVAPGKQIGTLTSKEINFAIGFLSKLVETKGLPPKVLVVHRFRRDMVKGAKEIALDPRVQVVMHMDGWGVPAIKLSSYEQYVLSEPVQFTGFKLFFRHDTQFGDRLLTPMELVQLRPAPLYIQYQ